MAGQLFPTTATAEVAGDAAHTFDPQSESEMAKAFRAILSEDGLRSQLRANGLARAARFRWDRVLPELLEAYRFARRADDKRL